MTENAENGWVLDQEERQRMADACLRGESVMFNCLVVQRGLTMKIKPISPLSEVSVVGNQFDFDLPVEVVVGEDDAPLGLRDE